MQNEGNFFRHLKHSLIISLLIHFILIISLFTFTKVQPLKRAPILNIDILPLSATASKNIAKAEQAPSKTSMQVKAKDKVAPRLLNLSVLALEKGLPRDTDSHKEGSLQERNRAGSGNGFALAEKMDLNTEAKLYPFFHGLWKKIDAAIGYPVDFTKARIQGSVQLQFEVDAKGVMTGRVLQLDSESKHLKAYVVAILVHALMTPLPEQNWSSMDRTIIVAQFDFEIFTTGSNREPQKANHIKNVLTFKRASYATPKLNDLIEKFYERFIPPVFPIPGGFYIDFPRAYRMIESIGTPDPDEMRNERIQLKLEEWSRAVKEKQ